MNTLFRTLLLGWFLTYLPQALAENMSSLDNAHMQQMVHQMNKMQQCLQEIDEIELQKNQAHLNQIENELRDLCGAGKREEAQEKALEFSKEMQNSKTFTRIQACSKEMQQQGFMPKFPTLELDEQGKSTGHICDQLK
ncbi:hypothetical protein QCB45_02990 [Thiomicrorhabdus sp. ZW0627]|uniref:hypothetical protein n=1 Tax=Thiomicrorhabdus sp. ZW0627 TaxID=3039774 RepID=UPI0024373A8E|nr:hypothetical protein [Thiomicrorhabdus sp. ZW0627]MDG6773285.1 hypothetical protein [Thiomicrorhabdus sp. ZW0627]